MAKELITKKKRHICSMKGCGNRDSRLFSKSEDLFGSLYLCDDCITAIAAFSGVKKREKK